MSTQAMKGVSLEPWRFDIRYHVANFVGFVVALRQAARERRQLLDLKDRDLADIGITRVDALREAERPLWRSVFTSHDRWSGGSP